MSQVEAARVAPIAKTKTSFNVLYLTWAEDLLHSGILRNQVVELLRTIKREDRSIGISLASGLPLNKKVFNARGFRERLHNLDAYFRSSAIGFFPRRTLVPSRFFYSRLQELPLVYCGHICYMANLFRQLKVNIVHCRSYHAAILALMARRFARHPARIIVDTRGLFVDEAVLFRRFREGDSHFRAWRKLERFLLDHADYIVNVSETHTELVRALTTNPNTATIPTSVDLATFRQDAAMDRGALRRYLHIPQLSKVLVYSGSLRRDGWYSAQVLARIYGAFRRTFRDTRLLIVTQSEHDAIREALITSATPMEEVIIRSGESSRQVASFLHIADYGAIPYRPISSDIEARIAYTVIASKTGEYLVAGLPVIVNEAVGAAANLITEHGVGCTFRDGDEATLDSSLRELGRSYYPVSQRCTSVGTTYFNAEEHARKYITVYRQLASRKLPMERMLS